MPKKIAATKKGVRGWFLHLLIFIIAVTVLWYICYQGKDGWVYPWPAWITAAWALGMIGHACLVWSSYEDKGFNEWREQTLNG